MAETLIVCFFWKRVHSFSNSKPPYFGFHVTFFVGIYTVYIYIFPRTFHFGRPRLSGIAFFFVIFGTDARCEGFEKDLTLPETNRVLSPENQPGWKMNFLLRSPSLFS